ncbi:chemotaxis protein [Paenibacillus tarimensis]
MEQKVAVMILHGMGSQKEDFADSFADSLKEMFGKVTGGNPSANTSLAIEPVHWADVFEGREQRLYDSLAPYKLNYNLLRRFVIHYLADAIAYQPVETQGQNYDAVHDTISQALNRLSSKAGPAAPLCVISHSLGTIIASNYFYDLQYPSSRQPGIINPSSPLENGHTLTLFYSFGTTLPLWSLRYQDFDKPIHVPCQHAKKYYPGLEGEWVNYYDKDDILGYPLRIVDPAYENCVKEDIEINVGNWLTSWNPFCHNGYFTSETIIRRIAENLARTWSYVNRVG